MRTVKKWQLILAALPIVYTVVIGVISIWVPEITCYIPIAPLCLVFFLPLSATLRRQLWVILAIVSTLYIAPVLGLLTQRKKAYSYFCPAICMIDALITALLLVNVELRSFVLQSKLLYGIEVILVSCSLELLFGGLEWFVFSDSNHSIIQQIVNKRKKNVYHLVIARQLRMIQKKHQHASQASDNVSLDIENDIVENQRQLKESGTWH